MSFITKLGVSLTLRSTLLLPKNGQQLLTELPNRVLVNAIKKTAKYRVTGVNVLYGPPNSEKTLSTVHACRELAKDGHSCIVIDCSEFEGQLSDEMRKVWKQLGHNPTGIFYFDELFTNTNKKALVVFDHFDSLSKNHNEFNLNFLIVRMALRARLYNKFSVQINVSDCTRYGEILKLNDGQKILPLLW